MSAGTDLTALLAGHAWTGSRLVQVDQPSGSDELDHYRFRVTCRCGWFTLTAVDQTQRGNDERDFGTIHAAHVASVVSAAYTLTPKETR